MHLTSHITHSNGYVPYIAYYRSNGVDQLFRKLKPKPKLNPPNAHRSQIKICENRQTQNVQFPFMPNAFRILKPIQKSSKRVWVFRNTGANAFAKNQMRLAYEDKRDLYCTIFSMTNYQYMYQLLILFWYIFMMFEIYILFIVCIFGRYCPGGPDSDFEYSTQSYTGYEVSWLSHYIFVFVVTVYMYFKISNFIE